MRTWILSWGLLALVRLATLGCKNSGELQRSGQRAVGQPAASDVGPSTRASPEPESPQGSGTVGSGSK